MTKPAWMIYPCLFFVSVIAAPTEVKDSLEAKDKDVVAAQAEKAQPEKKEPAKDTKAGAEKTPDKAKQDKTGKPKKAYLMYQAADSELKFGIKLRMPEFFMARIFAS